MGEVNKQQQQPLSGATDVRGEGSRVEAHEMQQQPLSDAAGAGGEGSMANAPQQQQQPLRNAARARGESSMVSAIEQQQQPLSHAASAGRESSMAERPRHQQQQSHCSEVIVLQESPDKPPNPTAAQPEGTSREARSTTAVQASKTPQAAEAQQRTKSELWLKEFEHASHTAKADQASKGLEEAIDRGDKWNANYQSKQLGRNTWMAETTAESVKCLQAELQATSAEEKRAHGQDEVEWEDI